MKEKYYRHTVSTLQLREATDGEPSRVIEGYAIRFNEWSADLLCGHDPEMELYEMIAPEAVTKELLDGCDIKLTMFHDGQLILGRSNRGSGSMSYSVDDQGVKFGCELPATADGDKALELIKRGDIAGCSFAFFTDWADEECVTVNIEKSKDGKDIARATISKIMEVVDFTLTDNPAYPTTSVDLRELVENRRFNPDERQQQEINPQKQEREMEKTLTQVVRERISGGRFELNLRAGGTVLSSALEGMTVKNIQPTVEALAAGLVYDKLGIKVLPSNGGEYVWPVAGAAQTKIAGENVAVAAQTIDFSKIVARPERFASVYEITNEALLASDNVVEDVVLRAMYQSAQVAINKVICSPTKVTGAANLQGPFVAASATAKAKAVTVSFASINGLKASLMKAGVDMTKAAFIVSPARYCELEATPKAAGSGIMMIEDGKLCGLPVYVTDEITDAYIGLGDFTCQAAGFFDGMKLIVDPYTGADRAAVRFVLNFNFATATLRPDAFVVGKFPTA